jgi:NADH-quinone oxidoreductase subunit C
VIAETEAILAEIRAALPDAAVTLLKNPGPAAQHSLLIGNDDLPRVAGFLRETLAFDLLSNLTGVDWPDSKKADAVAVPEGEGSPAESGFLEAVYHLYSTTRRIGPLVLRARTVDRDQQNQIPSLVSVFRSAEFQEREIFDLFGIVFTGHPDLRRILMWDEFVDHPMRKDYVAPDDYEYEPTPHDAVLEKAKKHYPVRETQDFKTQDAREESVG